MSAAKSKYDLCIIGSGPAGYRAAMQAVKLAKRVAIIEKTPSQLGGAWIHTGTIPSKTLRESLDAIHNIRFHAGRPWVERILASGTLDALLGRARAVAESEENIVRRYFDRYNIEVIEGYGTLESRDSVRVHLRDDSVKIVEADHIMIATGSRPRRPDNIPFDGWRVLDGDDIFHMEQRPKDMVIYGAGVIGCEYACIFAAMGVKVTLVDSRDKILQYLDQDVVSVLAESMAEQGVDFILGRRLEGVECHGPRVTSTLCDGTKVKTDVLFFAAGRTPNTDKLGLEKLGIKTTDRGAIEVNQHFQTVIPSIYAAGDAIGSPALAATSASQGRLAACHMFESHCKSFPQEFPVGVYTIPELSSVGATEEELIKENRPYVVGRANYHEVARGYIRGDAHGLLKLLVCRDTHQILGIHIVGHDSANLVHIGLAFMQKKGHAQDFVDMVFNYPTLAEAYRIAAFNALNKLFPAGEIGPPPSAETQDEQVMGQTPRLVSSKA